MITFYILNMVNFFCNVTSIGCFYGYYKVRNQTQSRLVIYVNNTVCPGKLRTNALGTLSRMTHNVSTHCLYNELTRLQHCRFGAKKITYASS